MPNKDDCDWLIGTAQVLMSCQSYLISAESIRTQATMSVVILQFLATRIFYTMLFFDILSIA